MRMWLTDPRGMCRKHLLGEHVEHHMFIGHMKKKRGVNGYLKNNCLEMLSLYQRHKELAAEMRRRGYSHKSELEFKDTLCVYKYDQWQRDIQINKEESLKELTERCPDCRKRFAAI
jgi:hypothetical protein